MGWDETVLFNFNKAGLNVSQSRSSWRSQRKSHTQFQLVGEDLKDTYFIPKRIHFVAQKDANLRVTLC